MINRKILALLFVAATVVWAIILWLDLLPVNLPNGTFIAKPYLQLGTSGLLSLLWQTKDEAGQWKIEIKKEGQWQPGPEPIKKRIEVDSIPPYNLFSADLSGVGTKSFDYRILRDGKVEFSAGARQRVEKDSKFRFVVFGDAGENTPGQRKIAYQVSQANPNFVMIVGDIVYPDGRLREYLDHFFPVYNNENASPGTGAPLMRSTLFVAAPGNHDIGTAAIFITRNFSHFPDSLAYFYEWLQPLNGPGKSVGGVNTPVLIGNPGRQERFKIAAGPNYPTMANFFFDLGDARFIVLDGNDYMDWSNQDWRNWLEKTLVDAKSKKWRFVLFHQAPFNSDTTHFTEQRMRSICDILERNNVRIVFSGHVHNYQRTYPLHFAPAALKPDRAGTMDGKLTFSKGGDPQGQITYVVTGAGGATLNGKGVATAPANWQNFTAKFVANAHSFSICDVDGDKLSVQQVTEDGNIIDQFSIIANASSSTIPQQTIPVNAPRPTPMRH